MAVLQADGVEIFYEDRGEGEPLVLIHGAAASGRWFEDLLPQLAESHRVIVPDLRGLGRSQRVESLASPQVWVEDMWRVMEAAEIDRADVIGVSLGSRIAGRMALEDPTKVRSLIVDAPIIGISSQGNTSLQNRFTEVDPNSEQAEEWRRLHGPDWQAAVAFYAKARSATGFQEYFTLREELSAIGVPTLICRGDFDDSVHPLDDAFIWHKQAPRSELFIAPGLSQSSVIQERPGDFLKALRPFLERVAALQPA
jgi:pimeloyl-ACP methyl ester carboxylesterase